MFCVCDLRSMILLFAFCLLLFYPSAVSANRQGFAIRGAFSPLAFHPRAFPELWQKMRRDQFSFHFLRSAAGLSALFPPSACAIDYQQKQSASGFMSCSSGRWSVVRGQLPVSGRTTTFNLFPISYFLLPTSYSLPILSSPKAVWTLRP